MIIHIQVNHNQQMSLNYFVFSNFNMMKKQEAKAYRIKYGQDFKHLNQSIRSIIKGQINNIYFILAIVETLRIAEGIKPVIGQCLCQILQINKNIKIAALRKDSFCRITKIINKITDFYLFVQSILSCHFFIPQYNQIGYQLHIIKINDYSAMYTINSTLTFSFSQSRRLLPLRLIYGDWYNYLKQDSYIFDTGLSYNKPTPLLSPLSAIVSLANAQPDHLYNLALSFQNLDYVIINYEINILITYTNKIYSSFGVNVFSTNTSNIRILGFRYLLINSNFSKFSVIYFTLTPNVNITGGGPYTTTVSGLEPVTGTISYFLVLTGFNVKAINYQTNLWFTSSGETPTAISITLNTIFNLMLYSTSFLLIRYNTSISVMPMRVQVSQYSNTFTLTVIDRSLNYNTKNTLFGIWGYVVSNDNFFNFNFLASNGSSTFSTTNIQAYGQTISAMVIYTYLSSCCASPTIYYYPISNTCFDICPPGLYANSIDQCQPCPHDCLQCKTNGNGECLSCPLNSFRSLSVTTGRCIPNIGYYDNGILAQAQPCANDCFSCASSTLCNICSPGKSSVIGGCSDIIGCSEISVTQNKGTCIACTTQFIKTSDNICVCPQGTWLVTKHCTDLIGCVSTMVVNGVLICNYCQYSFTLSSNSCACPYGYKLSTQTNKCIEICGDGILFKHPCDDGNLINGDGCSSTCQQQPNYKCYQGSQTHSSLCFYGKDYQITVDSIDKTQGQNQGVFVFKISPTVSSVVVAGLIESLQFICNQSITVKEWSITNSILTVKVDYTEDLQGNAAILTLKLNQKYSTQSNLSAPFTMKSKGVKLLFSENQAKIAMIENIFFGVLSFSFLLFVVGSLRHKMIGVQVLTTFQIILFTSTLSDRYTPPYVLLSYMSSATCNIMHPFNGQSNFYSKRPTFYSLFTFSQDNLYFSQEIICGVVLFCAFFPLARLVIRCIWKEQNRERALEKTECVARVIYNHGLFPFAIGFLFINVFAYSSSAYSDFHTSKTRIPIAIMQLFLTVTSAFVFFFEWAYGSTTSLKRRRESQITVTNTILRFERCSKDYIPVYLSYLFIIFTLFWFENMSGLPYPFYAAAGITLIIFVWFVCRRPYEDTIHNGGQILNLFLILFFTIWAILREYLSAFAVQENEILGMFLVLALIIISLITSAVRVIFECRIKYQGNGQNGKSMQQYTPFKSEANLNKSIGLQGNSYNQFAQKMKEMNPYSLHTQFIREQRLQWDQINKQRLLNGTQPLYGDTFMHTYSNDNPLLNVRNSQAGKKSIKYTQYYDLIIKKKEQSKESNLLLEKMNRQIFE